MSDPVRIGILGDYDPKSPTLPAIEKSLQHAASQLKLPVEGKWIATPSLLEPGAEKKLESFDGIWAAPGSPYKSFDGMLKGIEFARRRDWPFLGTCGGFQYALIECVRNVLGIKDADTAENNSGSKNIVIYPVACAVPDRAKGAPKLSGAIPEIRLRPGSYLQSYYSQDTVAKSTPNMSGPLWKPDSRWWRVARTARSAPSNRPPTVSTLRRCSSRNSHPNPTSPIPWCKRSCKQLPTGEERNWTTVFWNSGRQTSDLARNALGQVGACPERSRRDPSRSSEAQLALLLLSRNQFKRRITLHQFAKSLCRRTSRYRKISLNFPPELIQISLQDFRLLLIRERAKPQF